MKVDNILIEIREFAEANNLCAVEPRVLSDSANLIIHLYPYDVVVKVAVYGRKTEEIKECIIREISVANYLKNNNIPVVRPCESMNHGPHECDNHWFSLWRYEDKTDRGKLKTDALILAIKDLIMTMKKYPGQLPVLGVWKKVQNSALNLKKIDDLLYKTLLDRYEIINRFVTSIDEKDLAPSHGDAHIRNLYPALENWIWMDLEDASLMPKYWDLSSLLANIVLFNGLKISIADSVLNDDELVSDKKEFFMILKARVLMSIIGNLDMALQGLGNLEYANLQLAKFDELFKEIEDNLSCEGIDM